MRVRFLVLVVAILAMGAFPSGSAACSPAPPTPWFLETLSIHETYPFSGLLFVDDGYSLRVTFDEGRTVRVNGIEGPRPVSRLAAFEIINNTLFLGRVPVAELQPLNVIQDDRPEGVEVPSPQTGELLFYVDDTTFSIMFEVIYHLFPGYIPDSVYNYNHACRGVYELQSWIVVIASLILSGLIVVFIGKRAARPGQDAGPPSG